MIELALTPDTTFRQTKKLPYVANPLLCMCSDYPSHRSVKDSDGVSEGVAGTLTLLQDVTMSTQPICGFDWNADKLGLCVCTAFDQTLRVLIVTRLKTV